MARENLAVLEQQYALLAGTLGCEPRQEIPVVFLPPSTYRSTASENWSAGAFSHFDGKIRISVRRLAAGEDIIFTRTLTHELTHSFLAACGGENVPGEIHEGLAQYLAGQRLRYRLATRRALPRDGKMKVPDYYDSALSFVTYLLEHYRQDMLVDFLRALRATGDRDAASQKAYHSSYDELRREWLATTDPEA